MWVTRGSYLGHIRIALWVTGSSGWSTSVTHFQPCSTPSRVYEAWYECRLFQFINACRHFEMVKERSHCLLHSIKASISLCNWSTSKLDLIQWNSLVSSTNSNSVLLTQDDKSFSHINCNLTVCNSQRTEPCGTPLVYNILKLWKMTIDHKLTG